MPKLERYVVKNGRQLRMGYTTGSCAAAAAQAAAVTLLGGEPPVVVRQQTPAGILLELDVEDVQVGENSVSCAIRKDAGDDPDVTDGMLVYATVQRTESGILVDGGTGVGRVTRDGLNCRKGEAAINPVPRKMIQETLAQAAALFGYTGGLQAVIWAPDGAEIARKTFNSRLGIEGGISILGTSGLVEPMSEKALVDTICLEIDARRAQKQEFLLLTPGNYGRDFAMEAYGCPLEDGVKCSNYIGQALDYAVYRGFQQVVLLGHAGKLVKLAAGVMQTHSSVADSRMEVLASHSAMAGLDKWQVQQVFDCVTVEEADALLVEWGAAADVWKRIGGRVQFHLDYRVKDKAKVAFGAFLSRGIVVQSQDMERLLKNNRERG